ncbi:MAG: hypothetical protein RLZZ200_1093 [Pseudomonadota bacterium]|jgi:signal transduction histidine kinase
MTDTPPITVAPYIRRITVGFAAIGSLWLMVSDVLLAKALGIRGGPLWMMLVRDLAFALCVATLLHLVLRRGAGRDTLMVGPGWSRGRKLVYLYLFAVLSSAAMLLLSNEVAEFAGQRAVLILSIFPIVFSAYQGGFGPGIVATLIPALLMDFISPMPDVAGSLQSSLGLRQVMLLSAGLIISALMGRLHEATRRAKSALEELSTATSQLTTLNRDLELRVAERTAALSLANEELDSFAYAVSHDLRVPVRTMTGMVQVLQEDHAAVLPDDAQRCLNEIQRAGERMSDLIGGLLSLSRDVSAVLHDDVVDLSSIASSALAELSLNDPGRVLRVEVEPGITARGDERLLSSALQNLLGNAWKFTASAETARIVVHSELREGHCWICVVDNGQGFAPADAQSLFRPFYRAQSSGPAPGLGIGLATVQRIVQRHGGRIECEGCPGSGATFRFTIPSLRSQACRGR